VGEKHPDEKQRDGKHVGVRVLVQQTPHFLTRRALCCSENLPRISSRRFFDVT
jgi:hypothetical protein